MKDQTVVNLDDEDNVAVALGAFDADVWTDAIGQPLRILTPIPAGHKVATTTGLFERMRSDMDFNCGEILDGSLSIEEAGARLFQLMLAVASGGTTCSEENGIGERKFVPWLRGAAVM